MKSWERLFSVILVSFLSGCGNQLDEFQCTRADFEYIQGELEEYRALNQPGVFSTNAATFDFLTKLNDKLAAKCAVPVLKQCAAGQGAAGLRLVKNVHYLVGPINAFSLYGTRRIVQSHWIPRENLPFADVPKASYQSWIKSPATLQKTLNCFIQKSPVQ